MTKSLDMIIFKEGRKNTIVKALENEIKVLLLILVSKPLMDWWVS